jgi:ribosome biogenesis ATPase
MPQARSGAGAGPSSRRKRPRQDPETLAAKYAPPELKLSFLGGLQDQITQLMEIVVLPLLHPEIYQHTGVPRPRGVLLHGVPGGGKTQLVRCLAGVSGVYRSGVLNGCVSLNIRATVIVEMIATSDLFAYA